MPSGGAEVNTYRLTKQLNESSNNRKFENSEIVSYEKVSNYFVAYTNFRNKIKCKKIIFATGFNFDLFTNLPVCDSFVSYSIVTNPIINFGWKKDTLIQDYSSPYHYLRRLPDGRIIYGGEDTSFKFGDDIKENKANKKYALLLKNLKSMFPSISKKLQIDYAFCGAFGSTRNNVGYIGEISNNEYYFLSMGANGIVNAFACVDMLIERLKGKDNNDYFYLFSPLRNEKLKEKVSK